MNFLNAKANNVVEFTENFGLRFSYFNIKDRYINIDKSHVIVNGKYVNKQKKVFGLNKRDHQEGVRIIIR